MGTPDHGAQLRNSKNRHKRPDICLLFIEVWVRQSSNDVAFCHRVSELASSSLSTRHPAATVCHRVPGQNTRRENGPKILHDRESQISNSNIDGHLLVCRTQGRSNSASRFTMVNGIQVPVNQNHRLGRFQRLKGSKKPQALPPYSGMS